MEALALHTERQLAPNTLDLLTEQALAQLTMPVQVSEALVNVGVREKHQAQVAALREQYAGLTIKGVDDAEGYERVQKAITYVTSIATGIDKARAGVTAPWDKAKKKVDGYAKDLEEQVRDEILAPLLKIKVSFKEELDRQAREAKEAAERNIKERTDAVYRLGFTWNGMQFVHTLAGVTPIGKPDIEGLTDGAVELLLETAATQIGTAKRLADEAHKAEVERKRIADEEVEKQRAIAAENERRAAEIEAKEEVVNARLRTSRIDALKVRGMAEDCIDGTTQLLVIGKMRVRIDSLHELTTGGFDNLCRDAEEEKILVDQERAKQEAEAAERAMKQEADRKANDQRIRNEAAAAERKRLADEEARNKAEAEERIRQRGDLGTMEAVLDEIKTIWGKLLVRKQSLKSAIARHAVERAEKQLADTAAMLSNAANELKA